MKDKKIKTTNDRRYLALFVIFLSTIFLSNAFAAERSGRWPAVRDAYLADHPTCEACGCKTDLTVHHVEPFEIAPERELDSTNFITLCKKHHCHLMIGHLGDFKAWNPMVREDAARMIKRIKARPKSREDATKFSQQFLTAL